MTGHEELEREIPAYVASRLEPETARRLETHLTSCDPCSEMVANLMDIASALREEGPAILDDHPNPETLHAYALGRPGSGADRVASHVRVCASCDLEVSVMKRESIRRDTGFSPAAVPAGRRTKIASVALIAAAAGLVLGVALSIALLPEAPGLPGGFGPSIDIRRLRGEAASQTVRIGAGETIVTMNLQVELPPEAGDLDTFRFEVHRSEGGIVESWRISASRIRKYLDESGHVTLVIPAEKLPSGRYEVRVLQEGGEKPGSIMTRSFEVVRE